MREYKHKFDYSVIINLKRRGDDFSGGYECNVIDKEGNNIFKITPVGKEPQDSFNTLMKYWDYYMGNY